MTFQISQRGKEYLETARTLLRAAQTMTDRAIAGQLKALADDYERHVLPIMRDVFAGLADLDVPLIHFGVGTGELLTSMRAAGATVVGVDWRVPLDVAWERVGLDCAVQGNLDPAACLGPWNVVEAKAADVLRVQPGPRRAAWDPARDHGAARGAGA